MWPMQIVKHDTYKVFNVAAKLYLSICAHQLINIFMNTLILYSNNNLGEVFSVFKQFSTLCFYFHEKIVSSVIDIAC